MMLSKIILLFSIFSTLHLNAISSQYNILKNHDFEEGKSYWQAEGNTKLKITTNSYTGGKAIRYDHGGISQTTDQLSNIDGHKRFVLSGFYKNKGAVEGIWMGITCMDQNWKTLKEDEIALQNSYQYAPFAMVFTPPTGTVYITYWTWSDSPAKGQTLLDNLALYPENINTNNHPPLLQPIHDQQNNLGEDINLTLIANDPDHDTLIYAVKGLDEESNIYFNTQTGTFTGTATQKGTKAFKVYAIDNQGGIAEQSFQWQIISAPVTACNILQNSGFETNLLGWDIYGAKTQRVSDAYQGNYALLIQNGGLDQLSQELENKVDTYQFNGYYKNIGNSDGTWIGLNFYDSQFNIVLSKTIALPYSSKYRQFIVNATSTSNTRYVQAWVWSEAGEEGGKILLDALKISTSSCYNYVIPSSLPPKGIAVNKAPQFIVIGFDDNTKAEGIDWAINLFQNKKNADGSDARTSFFMNTKGLHEWIEDDPSKLLAAMQRLKNSGHEIANHTFAHHADIDASDWDQFIHTVLHLNQTQWSKKTADATYDLVNSVGVTASTIQGFRSPYLLYNQALFQSLKNDAFVYDCSIEEGYAQNFDGTNFRWPYQLDGGSPGHNEGWFGNGENENAVAINPVPGLWELPNHVLMIPKDNDCARYGIKTGLWQRIKNKVPYLEDYKITGFDYNLWSEAALTKADVLGILKYNLDLRLQGNRAPFMIGAHTQYYTQQWADTYAPNATVTQMREAISEFINYALNKPEVRILPAKDIIKWCNNPVALQ